MDNERLIRAEEEIKQVNKRLDTIEDKVDNITDLTISVKEIASEVKAMRVDMNKIDTRVQAIEDKPAKRYDNIVNQIIGLIVSAVCGFFIAKFIK